MNANQFLVTIHSAQPEALIAFYKDVVGLTPNFDVTHGAFMAGSSSFVAFHHRASQ